MDQKPDLSSLKLFIPSKMVALLAFLIACSLPFILVKTFSKKQANSQRLSSKTPSSRMVSTTQPKANNTISRNKLSRPLNKSIRSRHSHDSKKQNSLKTQAPITQTEGWKTIRTQPGDSLSVVFKRIGLSSQTLQAILSKNPYAKALSRLHTNQELKLLIKKQTLEKMVLPYTHLEQLLVIREGHQYKTKILTRKTTTQNQFITATIRGSLYGAAKQYNIPTTLIQQMTNIFTWDINFAKDVHPGDKFSMIYEARYIGDKRVGTGDILAVKYKTRNKTFEAIRHTNRNGFTNYYSPQGTSLKKAFERYPLHFSHISSTFSLSRYHPILHYRRAHKGVDLAAPIGTPIRATGDGRIEFIGRQSGYGNMIRIDHNKMYKTIYGHMLRFQKGLSRGSFVKRGQVIGYVGQTGLASGPHCHYEFHINRQPKNPTTVSLPRGFPIEAREIRSFKASSLKLLAKLNSSEKMTVAQR